MKVICCRCAGKVGLSSSNNILLKKFYQKHGLYLCGFCRRKLGLFYDPKATMRYIKERYL